MFSDHHLGVLWRCLCPPRTVPEAGFCSSPAFVCPSSWEPCSRSVRLPARPWTSTSWTAATTDAIPTWYKTCPRRKIHSSVGKNYGPVILQRYASHENYRSPLFVLLYEKRYRYYIDGGKANWCNPRFGRIRITLGFDRRVFNTDYVWLVIQKSFLPSESSNIF